MHLIQRIFCVGAAFAALAVVSTVSAQTPSTLEVVKKRGQLICGVNVGLGGFSLTRLIRSSRPATRTFCKSLNIWFGMPSGKSTKL